MGSSAIALHLSLSNREENRAMHIFKGSRLAGPNLKLSRTLVNEHGVSGNHVNILCPRHLHQLGFKRRIDHLEKIFCSQLVLLDWRLRFGALHSYGRSIDDYVEVGLR